MEFIKVIDCSKFSRDGLHGEKRALGQSQSETESPESQERGSGPDQGFSLSVPRTPMVEPPSSCSEINKDFSFHESFTTSS